jgi:hypothetical protein
MQIKTFIFFSFCLFNFLSFKNIHKKIVQTHTSLFYYILPHLKLIITKIINVQNNLNNTLNNLNLQKEAPK